MAKEYKVKTLKNGEKRYIFDVNLGYDGNGKRLRTTIRAKSIKEGRIQVANLMLGQKEIEHIDIMTFNEGYELYEYYYKNKANLSPQTVYSKQKRRNLYFHYFDSMKINKIKKVDIERWKDVETSHLSNTTINDLEREIAAFFNWLVRNNFISSSPMKNYTKTKVTKTKLNIWTEDEFKIFIKEVKDPNHKLMYTTLFYSGLRVGELLGLQYEDIHEHELHLSHTLKYTKELGYFLSEDFKTPKSKRIVPIPEWLEFSTGQTGRIFPVTFTAVRDVKNRACKRAGVTQIRIHDFRHSYAAMLINKDVDIYTVKELLGHDTIKTTLDTYGHLYDSKRKGISKLFDQQK